MRFGRCFRGGAGIKVLGGAVAALMTASVPAGQEAFNIDFGSAFGAPSAVYEGGGAQAGVWNEIGNVLAGIPITLNALDGTPGTVTITSLNNITGFSSDNADTTGEDTLLMDDALNLGGVGAMHTFTVDGLSEGTYTLYTYAWAPDNTTYRTEITVPGAPEPPQAIGGPWPGVFVEGTTHALHTVSVSSEGALTIQVETVFGFGTLNGLQIVPGGTAPPCPADFTGPLGEPDGEVGFPDLLQVLSVWGPCADCEEDLSGPTGDPDGEIGFPDLLIILSAWGACP